jgi:hypothetical protein
LGNQCFLLHAASPAACSKAIALINYLQSHNNRPLPGLSPLRRTPFLAKKAICRQLFLPVADYLLPGITKYNRLRIV